jgi:general secretion pathway protein I
MLNRNKRSGGFTLVEVMVALLVVSLAVSALLGNMMGNVDNTAYLRDKTIAHWVALNQLELERLRNNNTNSLLKNEVSGSEQMAGREWFWRIKASQFEGDWAGFAQLKVSVSTGVDAEPLVTLIGITDRYHKLL